ncbi:MAG TPA: kelch repeat-containing protein [Polyangiaceae bacterium]|nr:kelch repeat-containing protein [Polyangiaceae bacterium]
MRSRRWLAAFSTLALTTLTACPFTDDYYLMNDGGAAGVGGATAGGGTAAAGGGASGACSAANCSGACCSGVCVDLANDRSNCGRCANTCATGRICSVGTCASGWIPMAAPPAEFAAREKAAYTTFSDKVFVWGGLDANGNELRTGAIYDPALDTWKMSSVEPNTPSGRELATAVWTGSAVLVFGGRAHGDMALKDAALYDPVANRWTKVSDNPTARVAPSAAVYSGMVVFWSGLSGSLMPLGGADRYRVSSDMWNPSPTLNGPSRLGHTACAGVGASFFVFGGIDSTITGTDKAYRYSFSANTWSTISRGPSARWDAFGATDGASFYVWGGRDDEAVHGDGSRYDTQWVTLEASGAPSPRYAPLRESGWTFALEGPSFALLGGLDSSGAFLHDGGRYLSARDEWGRIAAWPSSEDHAYGVAASVTGELIVFGGRTGPTLSNTGERYGY